MSVVVGLRVKTSSHVVLRPDAADSVPKRPSGGRRCARPRSRLGPPARASGPRRARACVLWVIRSGRVWN